MDIIENLSIVLSFGFLITSVFFIIRSKTSWANKVILSIVTLILTGCLLYSLMVLIYLIAASFGLVNNFLFDLLFGPNRGGLPSIVFLDKLASFIFLLLFVSPSLVIILLEIVIIRWLKDANSVKDRLAKDTKIIIIAYILLIPIFFLLTWLSRFLPSVF